MLVNAQGIFGKSPEDFLNNPSEPAKAEPKKTEAKKSETAVTKVTAVFDTAKIHSLYLEGDFDKAIKPIESFLKSKQPMSRGDSTFAFKHLGVMYAAAPATREKGKYYMYQLINIEPTTKILDMYASDMIYLIYRNVQEDYELKQGKGAKIKSTESSTSAASGAAGALGTSPVNATGTANGADARGAPVSAKSKSKSESNRTTYLITGGAVVAVGVVGLAYILFNSPKSTTRTLVISE